MISERIAEIRHNIEKVCVSVYRNPREIFLIAVTKYASLEQVEELFSAGLDVVGESRVQDAGKKFSALEQKGFVFKRHMIGHLQTNKVNEAVTLFDMIQSVDSLKVAREIDKQAARLNKVMDVLVQVNSSHEDQKSGIDPDQTIRLLEEMSVLEHVRVSGLMTIGLLTTDQQKIRVCFERTKDIFDQAQKRFKGNERVEMKYLSMGMTQDYELAITCGSNMVRIGSAIFA